MEKRIITIDSLLENGFKIVSDGPHTIVLENKERGYMATALKDGSFIDVYKPGQR